MRLFQKDIIHKQMQCRCISIFVSTEYKNIVYPEHVAALFRTVASKTRTESKFFHRSLASSSTEIHVGSLYSGTPLKGHP